MFDEPLAFRLDGDLFLLSARNEPGFEVVDDRFASYIMGQFLREASTSIITRIHHLLKPVQRRRMPGPRPGGLARLFEEKTGESHCPRLLLQRRCRLVFPELVFEDVEAPMLHEFAEALPPEPLTWVEVLVVDDDDQPIPHVEYEIELSNGSRRRARTNEHGILRYEGIPSGTCQLVLVDQDNYLADAA